jgi:branched-chain amino acid aminotransferase
MAFIYNGELFEKEISLSPQHRGLRYGDGLFETIKVIDGKLMHGEKHFGRLFYGMKVLQIDSEKFHVEKMEKLCQKLMNHLDKKDGVIRINVIRKSIVRSKSNYNFDTIIEFLKDDNAGKYILNKVGLSIGFFEKYKIQPDELSNIKSNNRTLYTIAQQSMPIQYDDVLILNTNGKISDATIYNVFWVKDGKVFTNPASDGGVDGVMRKVIAEKLYGTEFEITIQSVKKQDLINADEIFLTNAVKGIRWVKTLEGLEKGNDTIKNIFSMVQNELI